MNKSVLFILALLGSSVSFACGYYPYGEDVRMCFFRPQYQDYEWYSEFYYTSRYFSEESQTTTTNSPNDIFWYDYCKGKVAMSIVKEAVYNLSPGKFNPVSGNMMVKYLYDNRDTEAINYLLFAKDCELGNAWTSDPWERNGQTLQQHRKSFIAKAISMSKASSNGEFRLRYAFLAMRMAHYSGDTEVVKSLFKSVFSSARDKRLVYYWALYFYTKTEDDSSKASYYAAQVFANAPDKRFAIYSDFNSKIPIADILKYAKDDKERANIYVLAAIRKHDKALDYIKQVYALDPENESLGFLMLREINKLEDWIYTPYYTLFSPSLEDSFDSNTEKVILKRVEEDRNYAAQVLRFVDAMHFGESYWMQAKAQLELMTKQYSKCTSTIRKLEKVGGLSNEAANQLRLIYALAVTAAQPFGKAIILEPVKEILLKNKEDQKFVFALGRELEYKGNTTDAALLYASLIGKYSDGQDRWTDVYWKDGKAREAYRDYYNDWFGYLNFKYTPEQVQLLIDDVAGAKTGDAFSDWKRGRISRNLPVLYDLLGTKYIRQDKLQEACNAFEKAGNEYWDHNYGFWERPSFFAGGNQFDQNPFYSLNYLGEVVANKEFAVLNKFTVVKSLLHYLKQANDIRQADRDYYYFLAGNCYYNMTDYGNSWMMRRFFQSTSETLTGLEDEEEYYGCNLARKYYGMAYRTAKTDKFRALCLRMMATCEHNRLTFVTGKAHDYTQASLNRYYKELKAKYPQHYDEIVWNGCENFKGYFEARR